MALDGLRSDYLEGANEAVRLLNDHAIASYWCVPSVLEGMPVSSLAGHLALSILQVEWFLDAQITEESRVDALGYFARLTETHLIENEFNRRTLERSEAAAKEGGGALARDSRAALLRLEERLCKEPEDRLVSVRHRPGETMLLDEYLKTRCVELAVHIEDLALSIRASWHVPDGALAVATNLLFDVALQRHGARAVLRAMTRRERDSVAALRVL